MDKEISEILRGSSSLDSAIARLTPQQKLTLIEHIARSINVPVTPSISNGQSVDPDTQRNNLLRFLDEVAKLPVKNPADGLSGRDHDVILYGRRS
jgi:hypothetical protein